MWKDFGSFDEVQVTTAAKSAEQSNPGTSLSFVIQGGGNDFHGEASADWSDSSFVSQNIDQALLDRGFSPSPNTFGFPNQQEYRYRSTDAEEAAGQFFLNPSSVRIYDYATFQKNGESYDSWFINDKINISRNLTVSLGLRWDR